MVDISKKPSEIALEDFGEPPEIEYIMWNNQTFHQRTTRVVPMPNYLVPNHSASNITAERAVKQLALPQFVNRYQEYQNGIEGIIIVIGSSGTMNDFLAQEVKDQSLPDGVTAKEAIQRLKLMCGRGIAKAALDTHSIIVTHGIEKGIVGYIGRANRDRHYRIPTLGIVGRGLVTYPGDDRVDDKGREPLQQDHTHFAMVETETDTWSVQRLRWDIIKALIDGAGNAPVDDTDPVNTDGAKVAPAPRGKLPAMVYLVNGGDREIHETLELVRMGIPVCIVSGTGGAADQVAAAYVDPNIDDTIPGDQVLEIIKEGVLEVVDIKEIDGVVMRDMTKRLFAGGDGGDQHKSLHNAWELQAVYQSNCTGYKVMGGYSHTVVLILTQIATILASSQGVLVDEGVLPDVGNDIFDILILVFPILISFLIAADNRFKFIAKYKVLLSAQNSLVSEIYTYRAKMGKYLTAPAAKYTFILQERVKIIRQNVMGTSVSEGTLLQNAVDVVKAKNYIIAEDDDGVSKLSPEDYIQKRLLKLLAWYENSCNTVDKTLKRYFTVYYGFNALALILAIICIAAPLVDTMLVAIPISISVAILGEVEYQGLEVKLISYNKSAVDIKNVVAWWRALTAIEQSNPQKFAKLVADTERAKLNEMQATNPGTDMTKQASSDGGADTFDLDHFLKDVSDNMDKTGKITFKGSWIATHPGFFVNYQVWLEGKLEDKLREIEGEMPEVDGEPPMPLPDVQVLGDEDPLFAVTQLQEIFNDKPVTADQYQEIEMSEPVESILWDDHDFYERTSKVVEVALGNTEWEHLEDCIKSMDIGDWMRRHQGWDGDVQGLIVVCGGTEQGNHWLEQDGQATKPMPDGLSPAQAVIRMKLAFTRGIVRAAINTHSVVVSSGNDLGLTQYLGWANKDRLHKAALVTCVSKAISTWPGDPRPDAEKRTPLQPDHTHFALLDAMYDQAGVTRFRVDMAKIMHKRVTVFGGSGYLPNIVFVMNGTVATEAEVLAYVRFGWPLSVFRGSGGCADEIFQSYNKLKDEFVPNPRMVEICKEGILDFVNFGESDGSNVEAIINGLFMGGGGGGGKDPVIEIAWEVATLYAANAKSAKAYGTFYLRCILGLGIIITACSCVVGAEGNAVGVDVRDILDLLVILLPIITSVMVLIANRFAFFSRASVLNAATEAVKVEVYQYRTGMGDYASQPDVKKDDLLALQLKEIGKAVMSTAVSESGLQPAAVEKARKEEFRQVNKKIGLDDDGFKIMAPDDYLTVRVCPEMKHYHIKSNETEFALRRLQTFIYFLGGVGTLLAALDYGVYVALVISIINAVQAWIESRRYEDKLAFYNQAASELESLIAWWKSLSNIQVANPLKFAQMVKIMEDVKKAEINLINPAGSGGGGGSLEETPIPGIDFAEFKNDINDNIQADGTVKFKQTWVEKHMGFFNQYEDFLDKGGFFQAKTQKITDTITKERIVAPLLIKYEEEQKAAAAEQ